MASIGIPFSRPFSPSFRDNSLKLSESRSGCIYQIIRTVALAVVESSIHLLTRDNLYEHEKPYQLKYRAAEGIPTTNIRLEKQESVKISSIRGQKRQFSFLKNGFTALKVNKKFSYDDFSNPAGVKRYLDMIAEQLKRRLGADEVQVCEYVVST